MQRVKELWDCNTSQRVMLQTLNEEGFDIKERELMRVRAKNRWLLRVPNSVKSKKRKSQEDIISKLQQVFYPDETSKHEEASNKSVEKIPTQNTSLLSYKPASPPLSPVVIKKRQERLSKLQAESAERWATRKRRRRTRGWEGLPADPPGPPRFPSETTIDESKALLSLDNWLYRDIRAQFKQICEDAAIIKKRIAGPERWEAAKDRLIQGSEHLKSVFWTSTENLDTKKTALDVICSDVTKRMRTLERRMTIAEAKNTLCINPEDSRQIRNAFYRVLKADHFTSKIEAGEEHWKALKNQWIRGSELLQNILAPGEADAKHQDKIKAMEIICRDVMKRLRDEQTKRDPMRKRSNTSTFNSQEAELQGKPTKINVKLQPESPFPIVQNRENQIQPPIDHFLSQFQQTTEFIDGVLLKVNDTLALSQIPPPRQVVADHEIQIDPSLLRVSANENSYFYQNSRNQSSGS